jgi:hypothetical protein
MKKFKELFESKQLKGKIKLPDGHLFLDYPKEIVLDIEDKYGDVIEDYVIDGNNATIYFKNVGPSKIDEILKYIKNV